MVHIGEISFCDNTAYNIKSDDTKKYILEKFENVYNLKIITKHYDKYEQDASDKLFSNLNKNPHLLCVRSNGNPYFLYLTNLNFVNYCIFIDKKIQQGYYYPRMIITHFHFDDTLFTDTVFDGEMIKMNGEKWVFMINDLIVYKGQHLKELNLVKRLNTLYTSLKKEFYPDFMDISRIQVKKYFTYDEIDKLRDHIDNKISYSCRGIYFRPLFLRFRDILINFDDSLIKKVERNKYKHTNNFLLKDDINDNTSNSSKSETDLPSLDIINDNVEITNCNKFLVRKTNIPDVYEIAPVDNPDTDKIQNLCIPTMKISKYMRELFIKKNMIDRIEMTLEFSDKFKKWIPII